MSSATDFRIFQQLQDPLRVYYGGISTQVNAARVFDDYPDREHLPNGSFPILSINCTNHDVLAGTNDKNPLTEKLRAMRWAKRYKPAELICILLATAQQQARRIDPETFRVYQDERGLLYVQVSALCLR